MKHVLIYKSGWLEGKRDEYICEVPYEDGKYNTYDEWGALVHVHIAGEAIKVLYQDKEYFDVVKEYSQDYRVILV